jgi:hypothetical protein
VAPKSDWQKRIARNWELKLLALLLAVLTYYAIRNATGSEETFDIPVEVELKPGIAVLEQDVDTVTVRLRGTEADLLRLDEKRMRVVIRPKDDEPDGIARLVEITHRDIEGAARVAVVGIKPEQIRLMFDREEEMEFLVTKPTTTGRPRIGKVEIDYEPKSVMVQGPKRLLKELIEEGRNEVSTEPVDVEARTADFTKRVKILSPGDTWVSGIQPDEITVKVKIIKASAERTWKKLKVLAIRDTGSGESIVFEPDSVDVSVEGRAEVIDSLTEAEMRFVVDCVGLDPSGSYELPVQPHLPVTEDVTVTIIPKVVKVIFTDILSR